VRSTLFYIPVEIAGLPVFGFGWLLAAWIVLSLALLGFLVRQQGWSRDTAGYVPFLAVVAVVIAFLLPNMVEIGSDGRPLGIPIRGFGVMMMLATIAAVGLADYRARQMGLDPEVIYSLAFCMFIAGIIGARLFFVVQYFEEFVRRNPQGAIDVPKSFVALFNVTQGGLVVYGSVIAGVPAGIWYLRLRRLPILAMGDIIAPSMAVGQAIGRIGCFLNGCCYGHPTSLPWGVVFPPDSFAGLEFGDAAVHPSQLYAALAGLVLFVVLWRLRRRIVTPGVLFWTFVVLFAVVRIPLDLTRSWEEGARVLAIGPVPLTESQFTSLAMLLFGLLMILRLRRESATAAAAARA
jgi:prolipoprotein diacylglyceryl transferase